MDSYDLSPEEKQAIVAAALRGQVALQNNSAQQNRFANLAAITRMANNPGAAEAAAAAHSAQQKRHAPMQMGQQGIAMPASGEFAPSPMFLEEQAAARANRRALQEDRQLSLQTMQQERLAAAAQLQQERLAAAAQRAAEANALRAAIAAMKTGVPDNKVEKQRNTDTAKFSASLEKAGAAEFADALDIVKDTLDKYKPGNLPGYGRVLGAVPNALGSDETQGVRSNMQQAANILLKARSGAAVTESEMRRFLTEVASGAGMSEQALRNGWQNVERTFGARLNNLLAGASPEVYDEYVSRGGRDFRGGKKQGAPALPPGLTLPPGAKYIGPAQ